MAPPFILEVLKPGKTPRIPVEIVAKNTYSPNVKVEDWQYKYEFPKPENPEAPPSECLCDAYKTTYKIMTEQLDTKMNYIDPNPRKDLFNYFGCREEMINSDKFNERRTFPVIMKHNFNVLSDYRTTMQASYTPPYDMILYRLRAPPEEFMVYRRMAGLESSTVNTKFLDDRAAIINEQYRCAKGGKRGHSYNFMTGYNTDGTLPKELTMVQDMFERKKQLKERKEI